MSGWPSDPGATKTKGAKNVLLLLVVGCLPVLLYSFTLRLPLMCDDHFGYAALAGTLYTVGEEYRVDKVIDPEILKTYPQVAPWWTSPDVKLIFLRPLTNFLFNLEYRVLGEKYGATAYHLANIVLNGLCCVFLFLVGRLLFRDDKIAFLGVFIFANHPSAAIVVPWIAEQASVLSLLFWLAGLYSHIRFRKGGAKGWEVLAWACFVCSFCARESGVLCFASYFLYDFFIWRRERPEQWPGIIRIGLYYVLFSIPLLIFVSYFVLFDYGVKGFYSIFDEQGPLSHAILYILKNVCLYAAGMVFFVPVFHKVNVLLFQSPLFLLLGLAVLALGLLLFYPGIRKGLLKDGTSFFFLSWMLIALLLILPLVTQGRYLYMALAPFGLFMSRYLFGIKRTNGFGKGTKPLFYGLVLFYAVLPIATILGLEVTKDAIYKAHSYQARVVKETRANLEGLPTPVNVFYLNMPNPILTFALQYAFDYYGEKGEVRVFPLIITRDVPRVEIVGDRSVLVTSRSNPLLESEPERLFMTDALNHPGAVRSNRFLTATIDKVEDGHIYGIRFDFIAPLDDERMRFFYMKDHHVHPAPLVRETDGRLRFDLPTDSNVP